MNFFLREKVWFFIAMFLLIINIIIVSVMFCHKHKHHHNFGEHFKGFNHHREHIASWQHEGIRHGRRMKDEKNNKRHFHRMEFLAAELNFSEEQKNQLKKIDEEIEAKKDSLFEKQEEFKNLFHQALYSENTTTQELKLLIKAISSNSESYNWLRIEKANKIKALCTNEQKEKLGTVFKEINFNRYRLEKNTR